MFQGLHEALEEKCVKRPLASSDCSRIVLVSLRPVLKREVWKRPQDVIGTPIGRSALLDCLDHLILSFCWLLSLIEQRHDMCGTAKRGGEESAPSALKNHPCYYCLNQQSFLHYYFWRRCWCHPGVVGHGGRLTLLRLVVKQAQVSLDPSRYAS
jgi:hypothetical protein